MLAGDNGFLRRTLDVSVAGDVDVRDEEEEKSLNSSLPKIILTAVNPALLTAYGLGGHPCFVISALILSCLPLSSSHPLSAPCPVCSQANATPSSNPSINAVTSATLLCAIAARKARMISGLNFGARSLEVRDEMLTIRGWKLREAEDEERRRRGRRRMERERGAW